MNAIMGMAELAIREKDSCSKNEHLLTVKQAGSNLLSIINDILDLTKIETGRLEITTAEYSFSSLVNDIINIIKMRAIDSHIRFVVNIDCGIPEKLTGDETRIRQILINVLGNAVKYTDKGYVLFTARSEVFDDKHVMIVFEIKDRGIGIKPDDIEKLFDDFTQVDLDRNKDIEGTGLGLAITRGLVTLMDGSIGVESKYGHGSTFTITLPQQYTTGEALASIDHPEEKSVLLLYERREMYASSIMNSLENLGVPCTLVSDCGALKEKLQSQKFPFLFIPYVLYSNNRELIQSSGSGIKPVILTEFGEVIPDINLNTLSMPAYCASIANILNGTSASYRYERKGELDNRFSAPGAKVLVVDDIDTNLKVVQGLLMPYDMCVDLCKNGFEAISAIQSKDYDLVFMDHRMPGMDGIETTLHIRNMGKADPYFENVPIVAITANAISGTKEMFMENGFNDFMSKPIDTVLLNTTLEKWIPKDKQKKYQPSVPGEPPTVPAGFKINGLNDEYGISLLRGNEAMYRKMLGIFYEEWIIKIPEIDAALANNNLPLYTTTVHGAKSASGLLGAEDLSKTAAVLEQAGERGDKAYIDAHNGEFIEMFEELLSAIKNVADFCP